MDFPWKPYNQRWVATYSDIEEIQDEIYTHDVIIHNEKFVDPNDPEIHTQNIENL